MFDIWHMPIKTIILLLTMVYLSSAFADDNGQSNVWSVINKNDKMLRNAIAVHTAKQGGAEVLINDKAFMKEYNELMFGLWKKEMSTKFTADEMVYLDRFYGHSLYRKFEGFQRDFHLKLSESPTQTFIKNYHLKNPGKKSESTAGVPKTSDPKKQSEPAPLKK